MTTIQAIVLGIIQGLTEFFPVSSSAHLQIVSNWLNLQEKNLLFDLACHLGTLGALLLYFRQELFTLLRTERKRLLGLSVALLPLLPAYFLLKPLREWAGQPHFLGYCLLITSGLLWMGEKIQMRLSTPRPLRDALVIGSMQALALIPGISRSASTISAARVMGWQTQEAVRFSFLLSIPAVCGGIFLEGIKVIRTPSIVPTGACIVGGLVAFCVGFALIRFAMKLLEKGTFRPFIWYCLILGCLLIWSRR